MSVSIRVWRVPQRARRVSAPRVRRVRIAVAVAEDAFGRLEEIASSCGAFGFRHDATLPSVGVITGSIAVDRLSSLRAVPGVVAVEIERPPRGAPFSGSC
jgi:hypothetical protein